MTTPAPISRMPLAQRPAPLSASRVPHGLAGPNALLADRERLEGRLALRLAAHLNRGADELPHDVLERLRVAREQAVAQRPRNLATQAAQAAGGIVAQRGGTAALGGGGREGPPLWWRAAVWLPALALFAGLIGIDQHLRLQQIEAAAEIDAQLLADDLPPDVYRDPGFQAYLRPPAP